MAVVAGVFAHPDDEAFGPGGTLAKLAHEGHEIHIVCCTDGDAGAGLKSVREKELLASAKILGVEKVHFLGFKDGDLSNNLYHKLEETLEKKLNEIVPETIITFAPDGVSGHIDHMVVTSVVNHLFPRLVNSQKIMYYCLRDLERRLVPDYFVHMPDGFSKDEVDMAVDVSAFWETFVAAVRAHVSQASDGEMFLELFSNLPKEEYFLVREKGNIKR